MHVVAETDRLILRYFTAADLDDLCALNADPDVLFFINGGRPIPREEIERESLPRYLRYREEASGYGYFVVAEKATGEFLGWMHLRAPADGPPDEPELGYRLKRSAWGKGYASEGARALIQRAFAELGARRVFATTMTVNRGSWRVMEKAGLRFVRTFFQDWPVQIPGDELGDVEYALTREEWQANQAAARP
jgi:RimJ/RimL family protein N-acetyltransferase